MPQTSNKVRLYNSGPSALLVVLVVLLSCTVLRTILFLSEAYRFNEPEFDKVSRQTYGIYWLICSLVLVYSVLSKSLIVWRVALLLNGGGYAIWGQLLFNTRGTEALNGLVTYFSLALLCFAVAMRADDPRPLLTLRQQIDATGEYLGSRT